jgi:hypothetical protein
MRYVLFGLRSLVRRRPSPRWAAAHKFGNSSVYIV